ncbi:MAG TPA: DUF2764 family protein [Spirochaetota bacterium]|nr:DUF2764 family protein [Spirochaetota bacterium]HNT12062.1 DUF2764 family protein [Spirochaetota bacterium]HNV49065.1 DUF2764 family protein [Spirochaetota bacterium]HPI23475.1 DUF2764 family protein [Spirochaetota bacterium]HPU88290.1 DUF2764 family protein [Spirochaetota bacterium]
MAQYYYVVASLPALVYDMEKPPALEYFLDACETGVSPEDMAMIRKTHLADVEPEEGESGVLGRWRNWERNLRNKLARLRAAKKSIDAEQFVRENADPHVEDKAAREAFEEASPLAAEDLLDWVRWTYLEELEQGHYFDIDRLVVYYLKLQLLWRKRSFDKERGAGVFSEIVGKISNEDYSSFKNVVEA